LKLDPFIQDTLGPLVVWVPVCPEVGCGLPVPREATNLIEDGGRIRFVTRESGADRTEQLTAWAERKMEDLASLSGFIFKSRSPSCAVDDVKIYLPGEEKPFKTGTGVFVKILTDRFPALPVVDDERFHEPEARENFMKWVFSKSRLN
jgi:uncharacterized protein YbbK (DUF523 family)